MSFKSWVKSKMAAKMVAILEYVTGPQWHIDSFSQDAQRLPDNPEIQLMDTSGATLKRKKSELAFKEVPSGRSRSRCDGPQKKKAGPSSSPSPVRGVHSRMPVVASDRPRRVWSEFVFFFL